MLKSNLKLALRNLVRNSKSHALINIIGLSVGFACAILIALFIYDEYSYDRHHKNADRIYRLAHNWKSQETVTPWARTSAPIGPAMGNAIPQIEKVVRVRKNPRTDLLAFKDKKFNEDGLFFADSTFFDIFSFKLLRGNPESALDKVNSILLTREMAEKYFGEEDPMGKIITYNQKIPLMVTGILDEVPDNSHFVFDFLVTFSTLKDVIGERRLEHWGWFDHHTYFLLKEEATPEEVSAAIPDFMEEHTPGWLAERMEPFIQPLTSIHLHSDLKDELTANSKEIYSYILGTVAVFILLMACINFMNLSTARFGSRALEIGVRKVMGATRKELIGYFLTESVLLSLVSFILSILIVMVLIPYFNDLTGKEIKFLTQQNTLLITILTGIAIITGLLSGAYPALYLSGLNPAGSLKGNIFHGKRNSLLRRILVVFQFTISLVMIMSILVISAQLTFFQNTTFGFEEEHIIVVPIKDREQNDRYQVITNKISDNEFISEVSFTSSLPGTNTGMTFTYFFPGSKTDERPMTAYMVDENFFNQFKLELLEGRSFDDGSVNDSTMEVILNETAIKELKLEQPLGQEVRGWVQGKVIGIVEDFNTKSLHHKIEPVIMVISPSWFRYITIKVQSDHVSEAVNYLESLWPELYHGHPLEFSFLDDDIDKLYKAEQKLTAVFKFFGAIALIIAGLGLVGLGTFTVEKRTKEIGIRKVMGSSSVRILGLLYMDFIKLFLAASLIGYPVSYYLMEQWLQNFAYKTDLTLFIYLIPALILLLILLISIGYQTIKASLLNPANILRDE